MMSRSSPRAGGRWRQTGLTTGSALLVLGLVLFGGCARYAPPPAPPAAPPEVAAPPAAPRPSAISRGSFKATAYAISGKTASGKRTRVGIVAADPRVLPLGTRIRISGAGAHSGEYVVSDTGRAIKGRDVDIYMENAAAAKKFGRKKVQVEVLTGGESVRASDAP